MPCCGRLCSQEKIFIFINIAFAMYSGALLSTAARLAWDPSTYTWFRFLCATQYRVSACYVLAAGAWLAALVYLAAAAAAARLAPPSSAAAAAPAHSLHLYIVGVVVLGVSEVWYGAWMVTSLVTWWRSAPQAELARRSADLVHDLKPALLAMERYRDVARPIYDMIEEMEHQAPNNVYVIVIFGLIGAILQVAAVIMARRIARAPRRGSEVELVKGDAEGAGEGGKSMKGGPGGEAVPCACDDDSDVGDCERAGTHPGWRKQANLRMYTILDKIF